MTKNDLITKIHEKFSFLPRKDIASCVRIILRSIIDSLKAGERVELRGFGVFSLRTRKSRTATLGQQGRTITFPARKVIHFKMSLELKRRLSDFR